MTQTHEPPPAEEIDRANRRAEYKPDSGGAGTNNGKDSSSARPFPGLTLADIMATPLKDPLRRISGLIGEGDYLTLVFGPSTAGKTFLMINLALTVMFGMPWFGRKTSACGVLYIAREGETGFFNRVKAHVLTGLDDIDLTGQPFRAITAPVNLGPQDEGQHVDRIVANIEELTSLHGVPVGLVVYDNMRAVAPGMHENYSEEIEAFFSKTREVARLTGASPVVVDNTGKDTDRGARGTQAKFDLADTVIEVTSGDGSRAWSPQKIRDGNTGNSYGFRLEDVPLGTVEDVDGEPKDISSAIVVIDEKFQLAKRSITRALRTGVDILEHLLSGNQAVENQPLGPGSPLVRTVEKEAFRKLYYQRRGDLENIEARNKAFNRFLVDGRNAGILNTQVLPDGQVLIWRL